ncbi:hypothetical protein [Microcoleus sp. B4-D4]|uniref:hypothetical protein n=1 Tax=Microcoleus sp. B4-D4 TaxID=2818667 RepID=UPI002FD2C679
MYGSFELKKEEGSSATDYVTDVTDVSQKEEGRRKKEEVISHWAERSGGIGPRRALAKQGIGQTGHQEDFNLGQSKV